MSMRTTSGASLPSAYATPRSFRSWSSSIFTVSAAVSFSCSAMSVIHESAARAPNRLNPVIGGQRLYLAVPGISLAVLDSQHGVVGNPGHGRDMTNAPFIFGKESANLLKQVIWAHDEPILGANAWLRQGIHALT